MADNIKDVHPFYKIVAVLCVGSVAKALFAPSRLSSPVATQVVQTASDVADKVIDVSVKGRS